ncbi:MAG: hypothetical protein ACHP7J_03940 [Terriglobales bacterium]
MAQVAQDVQHNFWRPPKATHELGAQQNLVEACDRCATEFIIGARFCHNCGATRPESSEAIRFQQRTVILRLSGVGKRLASLGKRLGLPTAPLIAFLFGIACMVGAAAIGLVYSTQTVLDWQAVQLWRIEWLLGAVAAFVAGCLLRPAR